MSVRRIHNNFLLAAGILIFGGGAPVAGKSQQIRPLGGFAFVRGAGIWIVYQNGRVEKDVAEGYDPEVSPDGRHLAYTVTRGPQGERSLEILDLRTRQKTSLTSVPRRHNYGPRWSPDGEKILFNHLNEERGWGVALVNADNTGFRALTDGVYPPGSGYHSGLYGPSWASDGLSFVCFDFTNIYLIDLDGRGLARYPLDDVLESDARSSDMTLDISPDGKKFLIVDEVYEDETRSLCFEAHGAGGHPALRIYDIETGKGRRLGPPGLAVSDPAWEPDGRHFTFRAYDERTKTPESVYRMAADGTGLRILAAGPEDAPSGE